MEVSSYQMEIPNKYFCPTVGRHEQLDLKLSVRMCRQSLSGNLVGIFAGFSGIEPYPRSFGAAQDNEELCAH